MTLLRNLVAAGSLCVATGLAFAADPPAEPPSAPVVAPPPEGGATYNSSGRRDPFRPFTLDIRRPQQPTQDELTPLQRYELGQLTVVGTIWSLKQPRAIIENSAGEGFIVNIGTPIGRNGGVVSAIEPERVIVEERVIDFYGNDQVNRVVMETPKEEGSNQPARERK